MTSSVLDGVGCESPAPPAFSPLTDPAPDPDLANREPSVGVPIGGETAAGVDAVPPQHDGDTAPANATDPDPASTTRPNGEPDHQQEPPPASGQEEPLPPQPATPAAQTRQASTAMDLDMPLDGSASYAASPGHDIYSPYTPHQSQLLMALARLSAASQSQMLTLPPSTVRPSQVSLPPNAALDSPDGFAPETSNAANAAPPVDAPLESFARIEFADSVFQMTTYAVIIGRDQRALDQARRDERRLEEYQRKVREHEERGLPPPSPPTQDRGKFSKSYVSEEGGMLGPESDGDENPRPVKRRKTSGGAGSAAGDAHHPYHHNHQPADPPTGEPGGYEDKNLTLNRQYVSHTPGAAAVNLSALRPSPHYVPFIGIHSPGPNIASRTKAISREHLKIQFNQETGVFEAIPLHKNGFFCEDVHYRDQKVVLRSGDRLQIKDVDFVFIINGVPRGKTGAETNLEEEGRSSGSRRYSEGGKEMSFDFESSHDPERRSTSPEEVPAAPARQEDDSSDSELSDPPPEDDVPEPEPGKAPEQDQVMETIEKDPPETTPAPNIKPEMSLEMLASLEPAIPKKRGPGRPPKNGIMSKREERLRKKAAMELAKKNMPQPPPGDPPVKRKVGRPRKHPLPENAPDRPEKRKYKPRKSKNGEEGEGGSDVEKTIKERRREKPKTPPLELRREDYTEEQLQKPPKNYGMLIDEVLSAAPNGLTLKQIYKRIQMKYPFYYFTVDTKGWESSVRHNLIGNDAFRKNEETHLWSRVPGIDIDAGKKRTKATSPDQHHSTSMQHTFGQHSNANSAVQGGQQQTFQAGTGMQQQQHQHQHQQGYRTSTTAAGPQRPGYAPGNSQGLMGQQHAHPQPGAQAAGAVAQQGPRQPYSVPGQMQGTTPRSAVAGHGYQATAVQQSQGNPQAAAYSSPYASRPPPSAAPVQPGAPPQGVARQGPPPGQPASQYNGLPRGNAPYAQNPPAGTRPGQPATNTNPVPLKPAVAPELVRHITNFKTTVTEQLKKRTPAAEAIAMSVINRGLGLAAESTIPEEESLEKIVLGVFESSRQNLGVNRSLHPGLVQALNNFKGNMIKTLEPKMGKLNAERLILSAIDRVLGFSDRSTMPGPDAEKKQYDEAENVLIAAIQRVVTEHQRTQAAVASASAPAPAPQPPAPRPGLSPGPMAPVSSTQTPVKGHAPAAPNPTTATPSSQFSSTAPHSQAARPAAPMPAHPAQAPARPSAPVPSAPANNGNNSSTNNGSTAASAPPMQHAPRPAPASTPTSQVSATPPPPPPPPPPSQIQSQAAQPPGSVQGPAPTPGRQSAPNTAVPGSQVTRPPPQQVAPAGTTTTTAAAAAAAAAAPPLPAHVSGSGPAQPQSPAHALAQAQAQAAAQNAQVQRPTQAPGSNAAPVPSVTQGPGQPTPQTVQINSAVPNTAVSVSTPTPSQQQQQTQQVPPGKPQTPAPAAHQPSQGAPKLPGTETTQVNGTAPAPTTTASSTSPAARAQTETSPPLPSPKLTEPVVAAAVTVQEKASHVISLPSQPPAQESSQAAAAASPHLATKQGVQPATSPATSQTLSQSSTPLPDASPATTTATSNQGGAQAAPKAQQTPTPAPDVPTQNPAPAAPSTNAAAATANSSTSIANPTCTTAAATTATNTTNSVTAIATNTNSPPVTAPPPPPTPPAAAVPAAR
ncbi:hypothetical protein VTH82DRAFT_1825 [Thermothelomyces myriococcoides]